MQRDLWPDNKWRDLVVAGVLWDVSQAPHVYYRTVMPDLRGLGVIITAV